MSKVFVLETTDADGEVHTVSVYDNLDNAKTAAQAWLVEQLAELLDDESKSTLMLEWQDHIGVSCTNPDDYEEKIFIWERDVITKPE